MVHGPASESVAHEEARLHGRVLSFGDGSGDPLRKGEARELVELLSTPTVGDKPFSVVVGPVDEVALATGDVLLKTVEEPFVHGPRLYLWARDLGEVLPTIRSRCVLKFAPGADPRLDFYTDRATKLVSAYIQGNWTVLIEEFREAKGETDLLVEAVVGVLASRLGDPSVQDDLLDLWAGLRRLRALKDAPLTPARVLAPFLVRVA